MADDIITEHAVSSGQLLGIKFDLLTGDDAEKFSQININDASELTGPRLGLPNSSSNCTQCGATSIRDCEGHCGVIKLPKHIYHPYWVQEVVHILNLFCPACKSIKKEVKNGLRLKKSISSLRKLLLGLKFQKSHSLLSRVSDVDIRNLKLSGIEKKWTTVDNQGCKYCTGTSGEWYPAVKFKFLGRDTQGKKCVAISAEISEKLPKKFGTKSLREVLPRDFWNFVPMNLSQHGKPDTTNISRITLSPAQAFYLLRELDKEFIEQFMPRRELIFLSCVPVTPNCQRVVETHNIYSDGPRCSFSQDKCTKAYKAVVDASKKIYELQQHQQFGFDAPSYIASRVHDCLNASKLRSNKKSNEDHSSYIHQSDHQPSSTGLRWVKDVVLSKRTDNTFRMVMVGDPKIHMGEIGLPQDICESLCIAEHINVYNLEKLKLICAKHLLSRDILHVRRNGKLVSLHRFNQLQVGDILFRPLETGDTLMINRNPSVHSHSLLALSVKVLPIDSVASINPLCCVPLLGDFDGDCLHGYVPQSAHARVELNEILSLDHQLFNVQNDRNLLSLTHDSLTAAHLLLEGEVFLNKFQMQQFQMYCPCISQYPAIVKSPRKQVPMWTGHQLLSLMFPLNRDVPSQYQNSISDIVSLIFRCHGRKALDLLSSAQEVLCEYLTTRGFSVSLSDVYLTREQCTRKKLIEEVNYGLEEAKRSCYFSELVADPETGLHLKALDEGDDLSHCINMSNFTRRRTATQASIVKFKDIFRELQSVIRHYVRSDNSLLTMVNAGSKGSLLKLVQQCVCLGLQLPATPLPFSVPVKLVGHGWNHHQACIKFTTMEDYLVSSGGQNSYCVIESSFMDGLNPLECFFHAVSSRSNMFSDNAELPGTLTRKLMFFMRDVCVAYDGTVRNLYGQQVIQFAYGLPEEEPNKDCEHCQSFPAEDSERNTAGQPVGSLAACSISEAAYGGLDQPISSLEPSPLLNLKKILECLPGKTSVDRTASLFLSDNLKKVNYGYEYGALAVKNHLDKVYFSDLVTSVMIFYATDEAKEMKGITLSPWVSHFHLNKEGLMRKRMNVQFILDVLTRKYEQEGELDKELPRLIIMSKSCNLNDEEKEHDICCIQVTVEASSSVDLLDTIRDSVIPILLNILIKGFMEFKSVDILWDSQSKGDGQLFLKVAMAESCAPGKFRRTLQNACIPIMDLINWNQSHQDGVYDICNKFGVISAYSYFLKSLNSAVSDIGRTVHLKHLLLVADSLSAGGEFHGLSAKGLKQQRAHIPVSAPFTQACFSNPDKCFIEAGKQGSVDHLYGTVDAVAWGKEAPVGTGAPFKIMYSGKVHNRRSDNVYGTLLGLNQDMTCQNPQQTDNNQREQKPAVVDTIGSSRRWERAITSKKQEGFNFDLMALTTTIGSWQGIEDMKYSLREILNKYTINDHLSEADELLVMEALSFHPNKKSKLGVGIKEIKVGHNPTHPGSRCFILVGNDEKEEDFSYRKCVIGAARQISAEFGLMVEKELYRNPTKRKDRISGSNFEQNWSKRRDRISEKGP